MLDNVERFDMQKNILDKSSDHLFGFCVFQQFLQEKTN